MKKGKNLLLVSGIFDIVFAVGLFALIALSFFGINYISQFVYSVWSMALMIDPNFVNYVQIIVYGTLGLLAIIGLLSLIFGSVSVARVRKDEKGYYNKGGRLIAFVILETIALLFLAFLLAVLLGVLPLPTIFSLTIIDLLPAIIIVGFLALIVVFRYISLGMFYSGKKKYIQTTPVA